MGHITRTPTSYVQDVGWCGACSGRSHLRRVQFHCADSRVSELPRVAVLRRSRSLQMAPGVPASGGQPALSPVYRHVWAKDGFARLPNGIATCYDLWCASVARYGPRPCLGWRPTDVGGKPGPYAFISYAQADEQVGGVGLCGGRVGAEIPRPATRRASHCCTHRFSVVAGSPATGKARAFACRDMPLGRESFCKGTGDCFAVTSRVQSCLRDVVCTWPARGPVPADSTCTDCPPQAAERPCCHQAGRQAPLPAPPQAPCCLHT